MLGDTGAPVIKKSESPFAVLATLPFAGEPTPPDAGSDPAPAGPARAVVRLERKHRRGKEVTIVEKLGLSGDQLEQWCREIKRSLGCGGTVERSAADGTGVLVLQGDFRHRLEGMLTKMGVRRVTISG